MEIKRKSHFWNVLLLLPFGFILAENSCPALPENLSCYTDYNYTISCVWNSTYEHLDSACTLEAAWQLQNGNLLKRSKYNSSCKLHPEDPSKPLQKTCTMFFEKMYRFVMYAKWLIIITCKTTELSVLFCPHNNIKLNPPPKPKVNLTTVVWFPQVFSHIRISKYRGQLQLRQLNEPWMNLSLFNECVPKGGSCSIQLPGDLIKGETYEARIRVKPMKYNSTWSEWSPPESWVATVGKEKPTPAPPAPNALASETVTLGTLGFLVAFVLMIILIRTDRTTWIYIVKRLRGPPVPHPGKSFLQEVDFKNLRNASFSSESFHLVVKPVEIAQIEVTSTSNAVVPTKLEEKIHGMLTVKAGHPLTSSSFSNPVYSHLSPQLPSTLLLAPDNPEGFDADTHVGCHSADKDLEQDEMLRLLAEGNCKSNFVISDYERVERAEMDRVRLQSLDSGVGSAEEVSQESLEAESINKTADEDEDEKEREESDFLKLFGGGGVVDKGSIQVCSGYEQIQKMPSDTAELLRLDSGISSSCGQLMIHEDSLTEEEESVLLLPSPHAPVP